MELAGAATPGAASLRDEAGRSRALKFILDCDSFATFEALWRKRALKWEGREVPIIDLSSGIAQTETISRARRQLPCRCCQPPSR